MRALEHTEEGSGGAGGQFRMFMSESFCIMSDLFDKTVAEGAR